MKTRFIVSLVTAILLLALQSATATIVHVPDDYSTIQTALDGASEGDTVLVACGTYYEHDVTMRPGVTLLSETGDATCVIIDAQTLGRVMICEEVGSYGSPDLIEGFTFRNGFSSNTGGGVVCVPFCHLTFRNCRFRTNSADWGGGLSVGVSSWATLENCEFVGNSAESGGGGMSLSSASSATLTGCHFTTNSAGCGGGLRCSYTGDAELEGCTFVGNESATHGAGIACGSDSDIDMAGCLLADNCAATSGGALSMSGEYEPSQAMLIGCTLTGNEAGALGGGIYCTDGAQISIARTIITFSNGAAICCGDANSTLSLLCCDLYGNTGGDWTGCVADLAGNVGNCSCDPLFCLGENPTQPYSLHEDSPCFFPAGGPCGANIGAFGIGCEPFSPVVRTSWGAIKALYR